MWHKAISEAGRQGLRRPEEPQWGVQVWFSMSRDTFGGFWEAGVTWLHGLAFKDASSCCAEMRQAREQAGRPLEWCYSSPGEHDGDDDWTRVRAVRMDKVGDLACILKGAKGACWWFGAHKQRHQSRIEVFGLSTGWTSYWGRNEEKWAVREESVVLSNVSLTPESHSVIS